MIPAKECSPPYRSPTKNRDREGAIDRSTSDHFTVSPYSHTRYAVHAVRTDLVRSGYAALRVTSPDTGIDIIAWDTQQIYLIAAHSVRNHLYLSDITTKFARVITSLRTCTATRYTTRQLRLIRQGYTPRIFTVYPGGIMEINPEKMTGTLKTSGRER